ncbi:ras-related protein Rab-33A isoform X1 [Dromaius novaehollandiae]|uniref:ras-related protein Rab-33A isoform X1 n=1 Tax=Dromaius novaehollandiae TaxID=8790 RepID=UPI00311FB38D
MAAGGGGRPPGPESSLEPYVQTRIFKIIVIGDSNVGKTCLTFRFCGGTFPEKTEATIGVDFREKTVEIEGERIKRHLPSSTAPLVARVCRESGTIARGEILPLSCCSDTRHRWISKVSGPPPAPGGGPQDRAGRRSRGAGGLSRMQKRVQVWDTAGQERFRKSMVEHYYRNVHAVVFVYDVTKMTSFTNLKMWIEECNGHAVPPLVPKVLVGNKCDLKELIQVPSSMALKFADAHNMLLFETSAKDPKESQNVESIFMCLACRLKAQKSLLYRDVERQQGRVQKLEFTQDANGKNSCPC